MLWYIGSPYTRYPDGMDAAHDEICRQVDFLLDKNVHCISPIAATHHIAKLNGRDPTIDNPLWMELNASIMRACNGLIIVMMGGWDRSSGVALEVKTFVEAGKPIVYMAPGVVPNAVLPFKPHARCHMGGKCKSRCAHDDMCAQ